MSIRVNVIYGKVPILLIAPHGPSDINTAIIAEVAANQLNCSAVINQGFERGETVDSEADIADCNRVDHCLEDVVRSEYLTPILKVRNSFHKINNNMVIDWDDKKLLICHIHGAGDIVHKEAGEDVGVIVGYGLGKEKDSLTCKTWRKNAFVECWRNTTLFGEAYEGAASGRYAGRSSNNMNQYFRKHLLDRQIESLQLEFPHSMRKDPLTASITGSTLAFALEEMRRYNELSQINIDHKFI